MEHQSRMLRKPESLRQPYLRNQSRQREDATGARNSAHLAAVSLSGCTYDTKTNAVIIILAPSTTGGYTIDTITTNTDLQDQRVAWSFKHLAQHAYGRLAARPTDDQVAEVAFRAGMSGLYAAAHALAADLSALTAADALDVLACGILPRKRDREIIAADVARLVDARRAHDVAGLMSNLDGTAYVGEAMMACDACIACYGDLAALSADFWTYDVERLVAGVEQHVRALIYSAAQRAAA